MKRKPNHQVVSRAFDVPLRSFDGKSFETVTVTVTVDLSEIAIKRARQVVASKTGKSRAMNGAVEITVGKKA